jgi:uncharacterized protein involved in type VI secretion and phage assembly
MNGAGSFYGKFRGVVSDNNDPEGRGRIKAKVSDVYGEKESGWALPAVPYAGNKVGFFFIPPKDALVWIEFEHGEPDYPIWTGCFWGSKDEVPDSPTSADIKVLKTEAATITLDDKSKSVTIETTSGLKLKMDNNGIEISNGSQKIMISSSSVSVDDGALEVM